MEDSDAGVGVPEQATEVLDVTPRGARSASSTGESGTRVEDDRATQEIEAVTEPNDAGGPIAAPPARARRVRVPKEVLDASFSLVIRGYDRRQVDAYVERVERVVAALQRRRSPQSAVKLALDRVGVQTAGVLQRAREAAEQITATALEDAEHVTRRASVEAEETRERAEADASALRDQAERESEELLARSGGEAEAKLRDAEEQAESTRRQAEEELSVMKGDIALAGELQLRALNGIRASAAELEQFADALERRRDLAADDADIPEGDGASERDPADGNGKARGRITLGAEPVGLAEWAATAADER